MKDKIISIFGNISGLFLGLLFLYLEVGGIVHSARKHSFGDTFVSVAIPPWAWYRSVEMWWHNDYADVNWNERLNTDRTSILMLYIGLSDNNIKANEAIEGFKERTNSYPKDKKDSLKSFLNIFVKWFKISIDEGNKMMKSIRANQGYKPSSSMVNIKKSLLNYKIPELTNNIAEDDSLTAIFAKSEYIDKIRSMSDNNWDTFLRDLTQGINKRYELAAILYKRIFDEDFK